MTAVSHYLVYFAPLHWGIRAPLWFARYPFWWQVMSLTLFYIWAGVVVCGVVRLAVKLAMETRRRG